MGEKLNIEGVSVTDLKKIELEKGDIFHVIKNTDSSYVDFGEAYFSKVHFGQIKGWTRHKKMTSNLIVPIGSIKFVIYDNREDSLTQSSFFSISLSVKNYKRLTISPGLWYAFKGESRDSNLVLNISDIIHDTDEMEKLSLDRIKYSW